MSKRRYAAMALATLSVTALAGGAEARELTSRRRSARRSLSKDIGRDVSKLRDALMREVYDKLDYARL